MPIQPGKSQQLAVLLSWCRASWQGGANTTAIRHIVTLGYSKTPLFLVVTAALTAVAIAMPLTYLVIRTAGVGEQLLTLVSRPQTLCCSTVQGWQRQSRFFRR